MKLEYKYEFNDHIVQHYIEKGFSKTRYRHDTIVNYLPLKYIQNIDRAAGALCEEAGVDAGDEPLEHLGVKQLGNRVATGVHLRNA